MMPISGSSRVEVIGFKTRVKLRISKPMDKLHRVQKQVIYLFFHTFRTVFGQIL